MFAPELRSCLHQALATPASILGCKCCRVKPNETSSSLPAISSAYKLHLECGKMINVYDWLQGYQVSSSCNNNNTHSDNVVSESNVVWTRTFMWKVTLLFDNFLHSVSSGCQRGYVRGVYSRIPSRPSGASGSWLCEANHTEDGPRSTPHLGFLLNSMVFAESAVLDGLNVSRFHRTINSYFYSN